MGGRGAGGGGGGGGGVRVEGKSEYEYTHGSKPRGQGNWAFNVGGETFTSKGTFSQAQSAAKKFARKKKVTSIKVLT